MTLFNCYLQLRRDDPRYSYVGDGDELLVGCTTSLEAAQAVQRLLAPAVVQVWRADQQRRWFA